LTKKCYYLYDSVFYTLLLALNFNRRNLKWIELITKVFKRNKNGVIWITKIKLPSYYIKNEGSFLMDYEIMMNGNVKIGTYAPDAERLYKGGVI